MAALGDESLASTIVRLSLGVLLLGFLAGTLALLGLRGMWPIVLAGYCFLVGAVIAPLPAAPARVCLCLGAGAGATASILGAVLVAMLFTETWTETVAPVPLYLVAVTMWAPFAIVLAVVVCGITRRFRGRSAGESIACSFCGYALPAPTAICPECGGKSPDINPD